MDSIRDSTYDVEADEADRKKLWVAAGADFGNIIVGLRFKFGI